MYCHAAKASLAPHGLFIMCASDLPGVEARVRRAADDAGMCLCFDISSETRTDMVY